MRERNAGSNSSFWRTRSPLLCTAMPPPTCSKLFARSKTVTSRPSVTALIAHVRPAGPAPTMPIRRFTMATPIYFCFLDQEGTTRCVAPRFFQNFRQADKCSCSFSGPHHDRRRTSVPSLLATQYVDCHPLAILSGARVKASGALWLCLWSSQGGVLVHEMGNLECEDCLWV